MGTRRSLTQLTVGAEWKVFAAEKDGESPGGRTCGEKLARFCLREQKCHFTEGDMEFIGIRQKQQWATAEAVINDLPLLC